MLVILPILIPLFTALLLLVGWNYRNYQRVVSTIGAAALLISGALLLANVSADGIQTLAIGSWPAPYGIVLVADLLGAIMVMLTGLMGFTVAIYSLASIDPERKAFGYYPLLHFLLLGVCGAFLTGDLFNLYVWFEVMLISSFVLLTLGGERAQLEGAIKYVTLNLLSSAIFLAAIAMVYGMVGTLNMADIARHLPEVAEASPGLLTSVAMLFFVAFGLKAAVFPLFFWLPASYHTPPIAVSAIFAGLLTKVGVYALIRVFTLLFVHNTEYTHTLLLAVAGMTMITGVLGAAAQNEIRRILSFHIVSQIGYMLMGLAIFTPLALAGSVFYIIHHIIVKTNLFLVGGVIHQLTGTYQLKKLGSLYRTTPWLGILFLIPALSLAGIPPLSGFWAKFALVRGGLEAGHYLLIGVSLLVGILTLYSMTKIWSEAFWKEKPEDEGLGQSPKVPHVRSQHSWFYLVMPIILLASCTIFLGLFMESGFSLAVRASEQLLNPQEYIQAVLGPERGN